MSDGNLGDKFMLEFCGKIRERFAQDPGAAMDAVGLLDGLLREGVTDKELEGTASTILEILEPARLGGLRCFQCGNDLRACDCQAT